MKLLQSSTIFKQRNNREVYCDYNFFMKIFTTSNLKNTIATPEKRSLAFLLILSFHDQKEIQ